MKINRELFTTNGDQSIELSIPLSGSLMVGNTIKDMEISKVQEEHKKSISKKSVQSFGLFGGDASYSDFVPGISSDDWTPKEGDYIYPMYRLFSETIVSKFGMPSDFTEVNLKRYVEMAKNITVYPDHKNDEVGNHLGVVVNAEWQDSYTIGNMKVPGGINGVLKLDARSNPKIARGVLMNPPAIHSGSITLRFAWKKSHDLSDEEFFDKAGSYDENGDLIRILATDIAGFNEYSLVSNGADRFAKQLEDGVIVNPSYANTFKQFSSFSADPEINKNPLYNKPMNFVELFKTELGESFEGLKLSEESPEEFVKSLVAAFNDVKTSSEELTSLKALMEDLSPETLTQLKKDSEELSNNSETLEFMKEQGSLDVVKEKVKNGETFLSDTRSDAIAKYKLISGESYQEAIAYTILNSSLETAKAFQSDYDTQLNKVLPLTCKNCNSHDISRASHKEDGEEKPKEVSFDDDMEKEATKRTRKASDIHGK